MPPVARIPAVDWSEGFDRRWYRGDAAATHAFNALSLLFPRAERFFVEVVREVAGADACRACDVLRGFVAQESSHCVVHQRYNALLREQGFEAVADDRIVRLQQQARRMRSALDRLAIVCAYEHYTAVLGAMIIAKPAMLAGANPTLALVWGWHAAEETEHKAVCFDLYRAAGGGWLRRVRMHVLVSLTFARLFARTYASLLWRDRCIAPARLAQTLFEAARFFFGVDGVGWPLAAGSLRYVAPHFHPWRVDNRAELAAWLEANAPKLRMAATGSG